MSGEPLNLGTAYASLELKTSALAAQASMAEGILKGMAVHVESIAGAMNKRLESDAARSAAAITASHRRAMTDLANQTARGMMAAGAAITAGLGMAVKAGADFEKKLNDVRNNTTMTTADFNIMKSTIKSLGSESSAPLSQLAEGFMHITNFGFKAAESQVILREAMKSAVSTGANTASAANILAAVMHEFGLKTNEAARAMNVLHLASALGNMTLEQFNQAAGPMMAYAAGIGLKLTDVAAAMSALTRHGFDAAEAATQVRNVIAHIVNPSNKAKEALGELSKASGIDLVRDFSVAGLSTRGLSGVMEDLRLVSQKTGKSLPEIVKDLIPAMRGGIGALVLAGRAWQDYGEIQGKVTASMRGETDPTSKAYAETTKTLAFQLGVLKNNVTFLAADVTKALMPALYSLLHGARDVLDIFNKLPDSAKSTGVQIAAAGGLALIAAGSLTKMAVAAFALNTNLKAVGMTLPGLLGMLTRVSIAAAGLIYLLDKRKGEMDESDRRQAAGINSLYPGKREGSDVMDNYSGMPNAQYRALKAYRASHLPGGWFGMPDIAYSTLRAGLPAAAVGSTRPPYTGGGDDGLSDKEKNRLEKEADQRKEATERALGEIFRMTHTDYEMQKRDAQAHYREEIEQGVARLTARKELALQLSKIDTDQLKESGELRKSALRIHTQSVGRELSILKGAASNTLGVLADVADKRMQMEAKTEGALQAVRDSINRTHNLWLATQAELQDWSEDKIESPFGPSQVGIGRRNISTSAGEEAGMTEMAGRWLKNTRTKQLSSEELRRQMRGSFGGMLGEELAHGISDGLAQNPEKAMGKSSIGKVFVRALMRWVDRELDDGLNRLFDGIGKVLQRKTQEKGASSFVGMNNIAGGGPQLPGMGGMGDAGMYMAGAGALSQAVQKRKYGPALGMAAGFAFGGPVGAMIGGAIGGLLGFDSGGWVPGPPGAPQLAVVHGGEHVASRDMIAHGAGPVSHYTTVNFDNVHIKSDMDIREIGRRVAREIQLSQPVRTGR